MQGKEDYGSMRMMQGESTHWAFLVGRFRGAIRRVQPDAGLFNFWNQRRRSHRSEEFDVREAVSLELSSRSRTTVRITKYTIHFFCYSKIASVGHAHPVVRTGVDF